MKYTGGAYNATTSFGGTYHPGTVFKPTSGQYPVFLKKGHFGFGKGSYNVQVKVWSTTGNTPGSLLATFPVATKRWPTNPQMGPLGDSFKGHGIPGKYPGYHYWSADDRSWRSWTTTDWAIECTVETNYTGIAPASLGRVKALYR
jgi:hypothetical protein